MVKTYEIDLEENLVNEASGIFETLGSDIDTAIKMFLTQATLRKGFPFDVVIPSAQETEAGECEAEASESETSSSEKDEKSSVAVSALELSSLTSEEKASSDENKNVPEAEGEAVFTEPAQKTNAAVSGEPALSEDEGQSEPVISAEDNAVSEQIPEASVVQKSSDIPAAEESSDSDSEDEDETAPEDLFGAWNFEETAK